MKSHTPTTKIDCPVCGRNTTIHTDPLVDEFCPCGNNLTFYYHEYKKEDRDMNNMIRVEVLDEYDENRPFRPLRTKVLGHHIVGLDDNAHIYDSKLEAKMATILLRNRIVFKPHVKFELFNREGDSFTYTLDFLFKYYHKLSKVPVAVRGVEVKGKLSNNSRVAAFKFKTNDQIWEADSDLVEYWDQNGLKSHLYDGEFWTKLESVDKGVPDD